MIPTAQVLADILNDPAIPSEALPPWGHFMDRENAAGRIERWVPEGEEARVNASLYVGMLAYLWERGHMVLTGTPGFARANDVFAPIRDATTNMAPNPTEALAAVVREVAKLLAKQEQLMRTLNDTCVLTIRTGREVNASAPAAPPASADRPDSPPGA